MCVVLQHILARGPAARPRCIPPACGAIQALSLLAPSKLFAVLSLASCGRCITSLPPPKRSIGFAQAGQGSVPATPNNPMTKGTSLPCGTLDQPCADWMRANVFRRWITASISVSGLRARNILACALAPSICIPNLPREAKRLRLCRRVIPLRLTGKLTLTPPGRVGMNGSPERSEGKIFRLCLFKKPRLEGGKVHSMTSHRLLEKCEQLA